jgi:3-deoxy-manno-octulosonate cytidylyltransferase (CMP-KDO synthetase)
MTDARTVPVKPVILIPARLKAARLPNKPLADICGQPMILHVWRRAVASGIGPVVVACDGPEIAEVVTKAGGVAVVTRPDHATGSDRVWEALSQLDGQADYDAIVNVQGDIPLIDPAAICAAFELLKNPEVDIATLAVAITDEADKQASQIVKAVFNLAEGATHGRALYFTRVAAPSGDGPLYHHVGLYAYRRKALATFVSSAPAPLEKRESLEQLRALSLGLRMEVGVIESVPLGVDTPADLEKVRRILRESLAQNARLGT